MHQVISHETITSDARLMFLASLSTRVLVILTFHPVTMNQSLTTLGIGGLAKLSLKTRSSTASLAKTIPSMIQLDGQSPLSTLEDQKLVPKIGIPKTILQMVKIDLGDNMITVVIETREMMIEREEGEKMLFEMFEWMPLNETDGTRLQERDGMMDTGKDARTFPKKSHFIVTKV